MPGMKKAKAAMAASSMDDKVLVHMDAIIGSMWCQGARQPGADERQAQEARRGGQRHQTCRPSTSC